MAGGGMGHASAHCARRSCRCARIARQTCDHPAKIVPAIIKAREELRPWEKYTRPEPETRPERLIEPSYVTPDEAAEILREVGLKP
jgi:hypothetical protein